MDADWTVEQSARIAAGRDFVETHVAPFAGQWERARSIDEGVLRELARGGFLASSVSADWGGGDWDALTCGVLHEEIGRHSSSLRTLLTVHGMVARAIARWGRPEQCRRWLPDLASGTRIGGFALSEPDVGSDARNVQTVAVREAGGFRLRGTKKWVSFGQRADLFLVFAKCERAEAAFLLEGSSPGLSRTAIQGQTGLRASQPAELLIDAWVPEEALLGRIGFGFSHVATDALSLGRYTVAWGSVGIARGCQEASLAYAQSRKQFGTPLIDHQLVDRLLTRMIAGTRAARLLCLCAGRLRDRKDPRAMYETMVAKYFATTHAMRSALDAVQVHGANGLSEDFLVERHFRDAKVMEIIEGSTQMHELMIAREAA